MDREKVLKAFNECLCRGNNYCAECYQKGPGFFGFVCRNKVCFDVFYLLKEQEAIEPVLDETTKRFYRCGACGEYVGFIDSDPGDPNEQDNYCRNCGREVKWK